MLGTIAIDAGPDGLRTRRGKSVGPHGRVFHDPDDFSRVRALLAAGTDRTTPRAEFAHERPLAAASRGPDSEADPFRPAGAAPVAEPISARGRTARRPSDSRHDRAASPEPHADAGHQF